MLVDGESANEREAFPEFLQPFCIDWRLLSFFLGTSSISSPSNSFILFSSLSGAGSSSGSFANRARSRVGMLCHCVLFGGIEGRGKWSKIRSPHPLEPFPPETMPGKKGSLKTDVFDCWSLFYIILVKNTLKKEGAVNTPSLFFGCCLQRGWSWANSQAINSLQLRGSHPFRLRQLGGFRPQRQEVFLWKLPFPNGKQLLHQKWHR